MTTRVTFVEGNIAKQVVDAIVNAANPHLRPGSGVSGAIHRAIGPELWTECQKLGHCETGQAVVTRGHTLSVRFVIHTVAPVYSHHAGQEAELLAHCYRSCLILAAERQVRSIAFPSLGTGTYGYPAAEATTIAIATVVEWIKQYPDQFSEIRFVAFTPKQLAEYQLAWHQNVPNGSYESDNKNDATF
ncbi:macro domain-containing protein [Candidatus Berkelbacteria bacterium]|nr:macro domain-containing protein [Candidatus Berkelbacteria bacterium]